MYENVTALFNYPISIYSTLFHKVLIMNIDDATFVSVLKFDELEEIGVFQ